MGEPFCQTVTMSLGAEENLSPWLTGTHGGLVILPAAARLCGGCPGHKQGRGKQLCNKLRFLTKVCFRIPMIPFCRATPQIMSMKCIYNGKKTPPTSTYLGRFTFEIWKMETCRYRRPFSLLQRWSQPPLEVCLKQCLGQVSLRVKALTSQTI